MYPTLSPKEREDEITRAHGAVFVAQIGAGLRWGSRMMDGHRTTTIGRSTGTSFSGTRYWDEPSRFAPWGSGSTRWRSTASLPAGCDDRRSLPFHRDLLAGALPQTVGGGIGQSRICMFYLDKAHVGEVQASVWPEETLRACEQAGVTLL